MVGVRFGAALDSPSHSCVLSTSLAIEDLRNGNFGDVNDGKLRNGKRAACNHGVMDARGRLLSTKEYRLV